MDKHYRNARYTVNFKAFSAAQIAAITGVDGSTARRYRRTRKAPPAVCQLLGLFQAGLVLPPDWAQWSRFEDGCLVVDGAERYQFGELRARFWTDQLREHELHQLQQRLAAIQGIALVTPPAPGDRRLQAAPEPARQKPRENARAEQQRARFHRVGGRRVPGSV